MKLIWQWLISSNTLLGMWLLIHVDPLCYLQINEFREYWVDLLFEHIQNQTIEDDFYIRDYIEQLLECDFRQGSCQNKTKNDVNSTYVEPGYAVVTMDAVYAFAAAVKNLHREKCGDTYDGVCQRMREALKTEFLAAVKAVRYFSFVKMCYTLLEKSFSIFSVSCWTHGKWIFFGFLELAIRLDYFSFNL